MDEEVGRNWSGTRTAFGCVAEKKTCQDGRRALGSFPRLFVC